MKDNRDILNEAFFRPASQAEKAKSKLPQYAPIDGRTIKQGSSLIPSVDAYSITSADEMKRRMASTFGVTFGGNSIKSMASKAIKTFPIIVSDAVEPETVVMLKRLMEEQYAEYINLLVSNQVIDLSAYRPNEGDGNIAIQALDTLSGSEFGTKAIADRAARTGTLDPDDIFKTIPLYTLLRENNLVLNTGDSITNALLEGALIVPESESQTLAEFVMNYADDIVNLNEKTEYSRYTGKRPGGQNNLDDFDSEQADLTINRDINIDIRRGFMGVDDNGIERYSKLTTADVVFDEGLLDAAINRSVGDVLVDPANIAIRDRFEKATFLLQSHRISGIEYYQYLTLRLGIPVSDRTRGELVRRYKAGNIVDYTNTNAKDRAGQLRKKHLDRIANSMDIVDDILKPKLKDVLKGLGITSLGGVAGGAVGLTIGSLTGNVGWKDLTTGLSAVSWETIGSGLGASAFIWGPIAGAAIGAGSFLILKAIKNARERRNTPKQEGWERVERLIEIMEARQADIVRNFEEKARREEALAAIKKQINDRKPQIKDISTSRNINLIPTDSEIEGAFSDEGLKNFKQQVEQIHKRVSVLAESVETMDDSKILSFKQMAVEPFNFEETLSEITEEVMQDLQLRATILSERAVRTTIPTTVKYVETKPGADVLLSPTNFTRTSYAYGSTEIERRENKDRKYNQPLIMKIKFKERYDDGKFSDSELTAVIGILGKVIRIPSEEMQYILTENIKGKTLDGFLAGGLTNAISDLLSKSKISSQLTKLPQSGEIWRNLEKVATLAAANTITGRRNSNMANAHIVFSQGEIDKCRIETGVDYLKDKTRTVSLMKHYSAFTLMVANDPGQRVYIFDDQEGISWNVLPYSAIAGKDNGEQLSAALAKLGRL